jgi:hypothetical protein
MVDTKDVGLSDPLSPIEAAVNSPHPFTTIVFPASTAVDVNGALFAVVSVVLPPAQLASVTVIPSWTAPYCSGVAVLLYVVCGILGAGGSPFNRDTNVEPPFKNVSD